METNLKKRRIIVLDGNADLGPEDVKHVLDICERCTALEEKDILFLKDLALRISRLLGPEAIAKLQALYSRSADSVLDQIQKVSSEVGFAKFMAKFYVEYGHNSIADCGTFTIFIENVSTLAAKAIQDWPLYSGQETSTRYINMMEQPIIDPLGSEASKKIHNEWLNFYKNSQDSLAEYLKTVYLMNEGEVEAVYNKTIKARVFDTLRAFLPSAICTQLSWHTNLRQAAEKLALLRHHPLLEVREIAAEIFKAVQEKYPASFSHKMYQEQEEYNAAYMAKHTYYHNPDSPDYAYKNNIKMEEIAQYEDELKNHPQKTNLPNFLDELGNCTCEFKLDFGSARDAQRHRKGTFRMPLLTTELGFHQWYLSELSPELREQALALIAEQTTRLSNLEASKETKQYYIPLGFLVSCKTTYSLPQMVYVSELRSGKTVHPTYRPIAQNMTRDLQRDFPMLALHSDMDKSDWDLRRGKNDIVIKEG